LFKSRIVNSGQRNAWFEVGTSRVQQLPVWSVDSWILLKNPNQRKVWSPLNCVNVQRNRAKTRFGSQNVKVHCNQGPTYLYIRVFHVLKTHLLRGPQWAKKGHPTVDGELLQRKPKIWCFEGIWIRDIHHRRQIGWSWDCLKHVFCYAVSKGKVVCLTVRIRSKFALWIDHD